MYVKEEMTTERIRKVDMPPKIHQLIMIDDETNLKNWLKEYPMDIETSYRKETPIYATIRYNSMKCLSVCLEKQAKVIPDSRTIRSPLIEAIYKRNKKAIQLIIEHCGAEDLSKHEIKDQSLLETIIKLDEVEILTLLHRLKVDVFTKDGNDCSPLTFATIWNAHK